MSDPGLKPNAGKPSEPSSKNWFFGSLNGMAIAWVRSCSSYKSENKTNINILIFDSITCTLFLSYLYNRTENVIFFLQSSLKIPQSRSNTEILFYEENIFSLFYMRTYVYNIISIKQNTCTKIIIYFARALATKQSNNNYFCIGII